MFFLKKISRDRRQIPQHRSQGPVGRSEAQLQAPELRRDPRGGQEDQEAPHVDPNVVRPTQAEGRRYHHRLPH